MGLRAALAVAAAVLLLAVTGPAPQLASGQVVVAAACTKSLVTSFTPCLAFISNGTRGGSWSPPTADCCRGLAMVVNVSTSCAQLLLTGQVALGIQVNCTLAVALPKACNSTISVALQCKDAPTAQINPPRGPATVPPATPPLPPTTPRAPTPAPTPAPAPAPALAPAPTGNAPMMSSAWRRGGRVSVLPALAVVLGVGAMMA